MQWPIEEIEMLGKQPASPKAFVLEVPSVTAEIGFFAKRVPQLDAV